MSDTEWQVSVLEDAFRIATQGLDVRRRVDRVACFYMRRRAKKLAGQNPGWTADQLSGALIVERAVVSTYVREKTALLLRGNDTKSPRHLDLNVMARVRAGNLWYANAIAQTLADQYPRDRGDFIAQIVWRAVALHDDVLWQQPMPPLRLETEALDEIVDRRLRVVERMACNVNSGGALVRTSDRSWTIAGPDGPWEDQLLVRPFEYPWLPEKPFRRHMDEMKARGWVPLGRDMIAYEPASGDRVHVPPRSVPSWAARRDGHVMWVRFKPDSSPTPSIAIQRLFKLGETNFRERNWFYCDHVGAALGVEAVWFGRTRRDGDTTAFDAVMRRPGPSEVGYVALGPVVDLDNGLFMADSSDHEFFENTAVDLDDLQVGDLVAVWNNQVYALLTTGAWPFEYSYVMGVDSNPWTGLIQQVWTEPQIRLAGHGLDTRLYNVMAAGLADALRAPIQRARERIGRALDIDPSTTAVPNAPNARFVQWTPYEDFDAPGAWWLEIEEPAWHKGFGYRDRAAALAGIPRTVADDPGGTGYRRPPSATAVYFPLWEPKVPRLSRKIKGGDSWRAYLARRKADPSYRAPTRLVELSVDGQLAPGLFYYGSRSLVQVVRPRVRR